MGLSCYLDKKHEGRWIQNAMEVAYLCYLAVIVWYTFILTTMFKIMWPENIDSTLRKIGFILVAIKVLMDKKWRWQDILFAFLVTLGFYGNWHVLRERDVAFYLLLILGAKDVSFDRIAKVYLWVEVPSILVTYVCSMMGIVAYLTYDAGNGWLSHAFGSIYRTDFSAHLFFLVCCMLWISRKKIWYWESIFILWIAWFVDRYCAARNSTICLIILGLGAFFIQFFRDIPRLVGRQHRDTLIANEKSDHQKTNFWERGEKFKQKIVFCSCFCMPVFAVAAVIFSRFYTPTQSWMAQINAWISNRLELGRKGFDLYNIKWFGQIIPQYGAGGIVNPSREYFYLDISYVNVLLCMGIIVFMTVLAIFVLSSLRAYKYHDYVCVFILLVVAIHCSIEHHLIAAAYDPFLMLIFANVGRSKNPAIRRTCQNGKNIGNGQRHQKRLHVL